jgi:uncharacterized protein YbbK (DUF523 family)
MRVLVSACLLGSRCRHDGSDRRHPELIRALGADAVAFCPEEAGGLGTPRPFARIAGEGGEAVLEGVARVLTEDGADVTEAYLEGARQAVARAEREGCTVAYLKERSPSCGCARVHTTDGPAAGCGVTTAMLRRAGIATVSVG